MAVLLHPYIFLISASDFCRFLPAVLVVVRAVGARLAAPAWCIWQLLVPFTAVIFPVARLAQSAERKALNLVVVGSIPTVGVWCLSIS